MTHEDLRAWIHRLYLMIVLPADRDCNSMMREERPSNISLFLLTLSRCVTHLGIPAHFVASIPEDLLKKKALVTTATLAPPHQVSTAATSQGRASITLLSKKV